MKVLKLNPFIGEEFNDLKDKILNTEFNKEGLEEFYKENHKYLLITLMDNETATSFDKNGTFTALNEDDDKLKFESTGSFSNYNKRRVSRDRVIEIFADVNNVFNFINFYENNKDLGILLGDDNNE